MSDSTPLQRAHAFSSRGSHLLRPSNPPTQALNQALESFRQAASLFEQSAGTMTGDEGARKTLELLTMQHRKMAKDLERRIAGSGLGAKVTAGPSREPDQVIPGGWTDTPALGIPPFSLRPTLPHSHTTTAQPTRPAPCTSAPIQPIRPEPVPTPLHSSSSSSDESFLHLDTLDPFSRFWGALETMLDDISNPVAFASAPLHLPPVEDMKGKRERGKRKEKGGKGRGKANEGGESGSDDFYLVSRDRLPIDEERQGSPSGKTPEEIALENDYLRTSLDALASHAQGLEQANKALREAGEERERMMRSVVVGVRREAAKAKVGQEMMRSQLLASVSAPRSGGRLPPGGGSGGMPEEGGSVTGLPKKVRELEEEVKELKGENEKQRAQVEKYKDRFDKLKMDARAKREAKLAIKGENEGSKRE